MPSSLPFRFRRTRVLIVGCGDVGVRVVRHLPRRVRILALTQQPERIPELRALGIVPLVGSLDKPATLRRLAGLARRIVHLAPPPTIGNRDPRTRNLLHALRRRTPPLRLVYGSTSGVYGDCQGEWITETRPTNAQTARGKRRVDAETQIRRWKGLGSILRIPGIYAPNREGGTPIARLQKGTPVLQAQDDVFTNHIHADDLARACCAALWRGKPQRVYHVNDDTVLKMGDYFDWAADFYGFPLPTRISRADAAIEIGAMQLSFMSESRRMVNTRLKKELRLVLRYPQIQQGLADSSTASFTN